MSTDLRPVTKSDIGAFLAEMRSIPTARGRIIFALDATASRQESWDTACELQAQMFDELASVGGLDVQLVYYRGLTECRVSRWVSQAKDLRALMAKITCEGGHTKIGKVLAHTKREAAIVKVSALVFVGDAVEEGVDTLSHAAGGLKVLGVPAFMFLEGTDRDARQAFQRIARLTSGAYARFDAGAARQLGQLLRAVAAFASGGVTALEHKRDEQAVKLLGQLRRRPS
jgi:hypothetical protein